ncbi:MAG: DEAD/DEAH box helicase [Catenulispora sp.]|nr:DEAD/DEAH box helicase [Catenulispora sp.]
MSAACLDGSPPGVGTIGVVRSRSETEDAAPAAASPGRDARKVLRGGKAFARECDELLEAAARARAVVVAEYQAAIEAARQGRFIRLPVEQLREPYGARFPLTALQRAGYQTAAQVLEASTEKLAQAKGISVETAVKLHRAAVVRRGELEHDATIRLEPGLTDELARALYDYDRVERLLGPLRARAEQYRDDAGRLRKSARPLHGRLRWMLSGPKRKAEAAEALGTLTKLLDDPGKAKFLEDLRRARQAVEDTTPPPIALVWRDFTARSAAYYSALDAALGEDVDVKTGGSREAELPPEVVAAVEAQPLDTSRLTATLRGYQHFGARYALAQKAVVLGDEMGLGKTVQAIAALAHLSASGRKHFFVVCPSSVMANWEREIGRLSTLTSWRVHGSGERDKVLSRWAREGGVAITTFDTLRVLAVPPRPLGLAVVDEAHFIKNPETARAKNVRALIKRAEHTILLSGTPLENRVAEFTELIGYLRPDLADALERSDEGDDPAAFRRIAAPAYLRRNQKDVLKELPEMVAVDEWVEFTDADQQEYREAVIAGHIMYVRQAAYRSGAASAKLQRLVELVDEARDNGLKVLIFSYFREVLATVEQALGERVVGRVTGDIAPGARLDLVDAFTKVDGHAVLLSQIDAGGTGLNVQAASVVILCEPQFKPSTEDQAIARAHRMGQNRVVQVYRLLAKDSVDDALLARLGAKAQLFDRYARRSAVADSSPSAVDGDLAAVSERVLARDLLAGEQKRLGVRRSGG